jgi:hypothetical protein
MSIPLSVLAAAAIKGSYRWDLPAYTPLAAWFGPLYVQVGPRTDVARGFSGFFPRTGKILTAGVSIRPGARAG